MNVIKTKIAGLLIIEPKVFGDEYGFFYETYQEARHNAAGITPDFIQDNRSRSTQNVLRGLHFQKTKPQGKLLAVTLGRVSDVAADLRPDSPTFGQHESVLLTGENKVQFYITPGFAHGFCVLNETADFQYKCNDYYEPTHDSRLLWHDPDQKIQWSIDESLLSDKDAYLPTLTENKYKLVKRWL